MLASAIVTIVAALLAVMVLRGLVRRQDERQRRHPAGTPVVAVQV